MDRKAIIDGLKMTMELCVFDPSTGEEIEPHLLNDMNRATYDACKGALEILERLDTDSDTISRQAAIDAINCVMVIKGIRSGKGITAEAVDCAKGIIADNIRQLPPIRPKRGRWIPVTNGRGGHECDQCHEYAPSFQSGAENLSNYCPNCGAKMEWVSE